ncbi:MAG: corrinoid protein-associated methyltransferase CpaM [Candidatus Binatia bacterium]
MSTYVLMKILESAPGRYDLGIRLLTFGSVGQVYNRLASHVGPGDRVLDIGCGTGALALRAAARGATVKGIDVNAEMLEIAKRDAHKAGVEGRVELAEMGVAELEGEQSESYDAVTSGLCFSELSPDELAYTLKQIRRILKPGGLLLVADEVRPRRILRRLFHTLVRAPLALVTYIITQQTTHPVAGLAEKLEEAGIGVVATHLSVLQSFGEFVARKPASAST